MRKNYVHLLLPAFFFVSLFSACDNGTSADSERDVNLIQDSTAFQNNASSDTAAVFEDQSNELQPDQELKAPEFPSVTKHSAKKSSKPVVSGNSSNNQQTTQSKETVDLQPSAKEETVANVEPVVAEKKGLNKTAQGAIIGGVAGAVGGAIISKKKGVGAVVGGVAGAAAGAIIGKQKDKKDQQKKEEQAKEQNQ